MTKPGIDFAFGFLDGTILGFLDHRDNPFVDIVVEAFEGLVEQIWSKDAIDVQEGIEFEEEIGELEHRMIAVCSAPADPGFGVDFRFLPLSEGMYPGTRLPEYSRWESPLCELTVLYGKPEQQNRQRWSRNRRRRILVSARRPTAWDQRKSVGRDRC